MAQKSLFWSVLFMHADVLAAVPLHVRAAPSQIRPSLVRIAHFSGTGGTTLCNVALRTSWVKMSNFQRSHNCNVNGSGPSTWQPVPRLKAPTHWWSACSHPGHRTNWIQYEHAWHVEFPCNRSVKHIGLVRAPWERFRSILKAHFFYERSPQETAARLAAARDCLHGRPCAANVTRLVDNHYVRFLMGAVSDAIPFGGMTEAHLAHCERVAKGFDLWIETNTLGNETALARLKSALGAPVAPLLHKNAHGANLTADARSVLSHIDALQPAFDRHNVLDEALYRFITSHGNYR